MSIRDVVRRERWAANAAEYRRLVDEHEAASDSGIAVKVRYYFTPADRETMAALGYLLPEYFDGWQTKVRLS